MHQHPKLAFAKTQQASIQLSLYHFQLNMISPADGHKGGQSTCRCLQWLNHCLLNCLQGCSLALLISTGHPLSLWEVCGAHWHMLHPSGPGLASSAEIEHPHGGQAVVPYLNSMCSG